MPRTRQTCENDMGTPPSIQNHGLGDFGDLSRSAKKCPRAGIATSRLFHSIDPRLARACSLKDTSELAPCALGFHGCANWPSNDKRELEGALAACQFSTPGHIYPPISAPPTIMVPQ